MGFRQNMMQPIASDERMADELRKRLQKNTPQQLAEMQLEYQAAEDASQAAAKSDLVKKLMIAKQTGQKLSENVMEEVAEYGGADKLIEEAGAADSFSTTDGISLAGKLAGSAITGATKSTDTGGQVAGGVVSGAATGASMGGVPGAVIGGVVGGIKGLLTSEAAKKAEKEKTRKEAENTKENRRQQAFANLMSAFRR